MRKEDGREHTQERGLHIQLWSGRLFSPVADKILLHLLTDLAGCSTLDDGKRGRERKCEGMGEGESDRKRGGGLKNGT
jgi:hypothetical protein